VNRAVITALAMAIATNVAAADPDPAPAATTDSPTPTTTTPTPTTTTPDPATQKQTFVLVDGMIQRHGVSFDLTLSGGLRLLHSGDETRWWFGRARAGVLLYSEPSFLMLGIAGQISPLGSRSLGVEVEYANLWQGYWVQAGVYPIDSTSGVSVSADLGYTLFGFEYQRRVSGDHSGDQALLFMLHVPIGVVYAVKKTPRGVTMMPTAR
jgi:hypothetical protein